jgi:hypothetical protein
LIFLPFKHEGPLEAAFVPAKKNQAKESVFF